MVDKRELILVRMEAILNAAKASDMFVWRDRAELGRGVNGEPLEIPAYVLLDGTETLLTVDQRRIGPQIMLLSPQVFYVPPPTENQFNEGMGPQLSSHRNLLVSRIKRDGELLSLVGENGYIEYRGMETDMQTGAEVKGQFRLDFALAYVLDITKL